MAESKTTAPPAAPGKVQVYRVVSQLASVLELFCMDKMVGEHLVVGEICRIVNRGEGIGLMQIVLKAVSRPQGEAGLFIINLIVYVPEFVKLIEIAFE
ncbi:MAG: hypothetical protein ACK5DE_10880 [Bacteroidota bacterium]